MKKLMTLAIAIPVMSLMGDTEKIGDYTWTYRINGDTAEIYKEWGRCAISPKPTTHVSIPVTLGGKPVTRLGECALFECYDLSSVTIGGYVKSIG